MSEKINNKQRHLNYYKEEDNEQFEINRPHNSGQFYNFLINYKFQKALKVLPFPIKGLSVLDACCGSGMVSEYYAQEGARVVGTDLSSCAVERARLRSKSYGFYAEFKEADVANLSFPDNSFDIVSVHDGLHHLSDPKKAVREMVRIAKKAVIIIEPAKALITELSVLLGFSLKYEGSDFVYRFRKSEIISWLKEIGIKKIIIKRYLMYYPHKPGRVFRIFDFLPLFYFIKIIFYLTNLFFGRLGNKIQVIGLK
ncbi:MAG: class I SAM-dependent methyltransferase [Candidatus Omnitrophica bacterium]|nr:class I SAM-dependent methyltransferase [Candidatus Omnitrophota bacterium]